MGRDYYEVLGIGRDASPDEIKKAYRKAALRDHPDRNPGDAEAEERFKEAATAYSVLGDADRRARYDRFGEQGVRGAPNFEADVFADFADILGGFFGFDVGLGRARRGGPRQGSSLEYRLDIELVQAITGDEVEIEVPRRRRCEACSGSGSTSGSGWSRCVQCAGRGRMLQRHGFLTVERPCNRCGGQGKVITDPCSECGGQGRAQERATLRVRIPPGVDTGMRLLLRGEGDSGIAGGPPGDIAVLINVRPDPRFVRRGQDLYTQVPVSFPRVALGGEVTLSTPEGEPVVLEIPAGAQSGDILEIRGRGVPSVNGGRSGDLKVALQVVTPSRLGGRERELLEELEELVPPPSVDEEDDPSWWDRLRAMFA